MKVAAHSVQRLLQQPMGPCIPHFDLIVSSAGVSGAMEARGRLTVRSSLLVSVIAVASQFCVYGLGPIAVARPPLTS